MDFLFPFKNTIDLKAFLQDVSKCDKEVFFESTEGDKLSLKSSLSHFILYSVCNSQPELLSGAVIRCQCEHDRKLLASYFE